MNWKKMRGYSLLWEVTKQLFGWYILRIGKFSVIYGSLSALIIFVLWVYYSSVVLLLGGKVAFLLEKKGGAHSWSDRGGHTTGLNGHVSKKP